MNILAVTCMRNEGPYCLEWIAHHRAAGVSDFLIYTHDCFDGTGDLLDQIAYVTHVPFAPEAGKSVQWQAMRLADKHPLMQKADWVVFFDCDEFLCLTPPMQTIPDLIAALPLNTDAIALPWRLFGASGHVEWEQGLVMDRFDQAAPFDLKLPAGYFFKTLYRPEKFQKLGVHRPKNKARIPAVWSIAGGSAAPEKFCADDSRINLFGLLQSPPLACLNHYSTKSVTEFMIKRTRGLPNRRQKNIDLGYWAERNFNTVHGPEIRPMRARMQSVLDGFHENSVLYRLQQKTLTAHQACFQSLMQQRENIMLFLHLTMLTGSTPPSPSQIKGHLSRLAGLAKK